MDDSYSNPVKRAQTSLSAQTQPTTYQVNVSRKKTRKWVEAKVQNYDGDDWGADEYDQESDQEPMPPPPMNPSLRTFSGTDLLHSRHNTPSPASSLSALPSLRTQAQQQQQQQPAAVPPPASQPPRVGVSSPDVSDVSIRSASESIASGHAVSPQSVTASQGRDGDSNLSLAGIAQLPSQMQHQDQQQQAPGGYDVSRTSSFERSIKPTPTPPVGGRSLSPQIFAPSAPPANQTPPIIYSPDNYSRLNDDNEHEPLALAPVIPPSIGGEDLSVSAPKPLSGVDRRDTWERDDDDSLHADQPNTQAARLDIESQAGIDRGRMSVSPKLPDLARMSAFGADLFASSTSKSAPVVPPVIEASPDIPSTVQSRWQPPPAPAEDEDHSEAPGGASLSQPNSLFPGRNIPDIPPLRTPTPHETQAADPLFDSQGSKITPTEPLQPRKGETLPDLDGPQPFHRVQTYSTAESSPMKDSPVKESDVLSDEIMRTLSPSGATPAEVKLSDGPQLHPPEDRSAVRESSYTLMDYDSYWADTAEDSGLEHESTPVPPPETDPAHSAQPGLKLATNPTPPPPAATTVTFDSILSPQQSQQLLQDQPQQPDEQQQPSSLRRRFSWEADEEHRTPTPTTPAQAQATGDGSSASALHLKPFEPSVTNLGNESRSHSPVSQLSQAQPTATGSGLGALALQTSGAMPGHDSSLPEPPSPVSVSVKSDRPSTTAREQARLSIADEKLLAEQGAISLVTGTPPPPPEAHPAVSSPTSAASVPAPQAPAPNPNPHAQTKVMNFRDIMALSTPAERIAKYNEARQALAARDSGLQSWLLYMTTEHPELSASISAPGGHLTSQATNNETSSQQQPYYQQYLNASSPSTSGPQVGGGGVGGSGGGGGRSRLGGLSMPSQMSGSAFGHSGNQIGTKSKEFMHSAGKMGKGLLSKGKSKLRGSGDKVDIISPDHPTPNKAQRRSTWRFSLEPKPREDDAAPHSSDDISTTPPQLPDPSPVSPLDAASGPGSAFPWSVSNDTPDPDLSAVKQPGDEHVRSGELLIADDFHHGPYASADQGENMLSAGQRLSDLSPDTVTPDDWVMVQHQGERSQAKRMSSSLRALGNTSSGPAIGPGADHHASQPQTQTQGQSQIQNQPLDGSSAPKRNSSFIGLPPIRRGSTFGTKSKARRASERFALDDDEDEDDGSPGGDGADINAHHFSPPSAIGASQHASEAVAGAGPRYGLEQTTNVGHHHHPQLPHSQQPQPSQQVWQQQQYRQQYPGGHGPQFVPAAPMLGSLVQKLPPAGPWKLEESHLSEPLHLTKKRSGTDISQQDAYYGYEKELGLDLPAAPVPAPQSPPARFRSDVPPSSARRYPELFQLSPGQDPRQQNRGPGFPPQMHNRPPGEGMAAPRQQQGGPESDERGRRRSSGILKEIGTRLARATSRERRGSVTEARRPSVQLRGDEVSETSVATEDTADRRKKRASFLGFSGRPSSTEQAIRREEDNTHQARQRDTRSAGGEPPADPREERKRAFFGAGQFKIGPGNFSRSSTSNSAFESAAGGGGGGGDGRDGGAAHKRRISDIAKVSGITGLFSRSRQDRASLGAMPRQQTDDRRQNPQFQNQASTVSRQSIQLPSLDFASDRLGSLSSLGFEESFQNYGHDEDAEKKKQQQHAFEHSAQKSFGDSKAFPAARGQERLAASPGLASSHLAPSSQMTALDPGRQNAQSHQPPLSTATPVARANVPQMGPQTVKSAAAEGQRVSGDIDLESPKFQVDSTTEQKTPRPRDFNFQEKIPPLPVKGFGVSEEDVLRSQTVSPDISIVSTSNKTEEQAPVQPHSHTPEHDGIVEGVLITPPPETSLLASDADLAAGRPVIHHTVSNDVPPSVHSFPSVSSLREKSDVKSLLQGGSSVHQTEGSVALSPEPSPQVAKSQVSSKAATPVSQHQQLHSPALASAKLPDAQNMEPPTTPRSHTRSESQQHLVDTAGRRNFPTSSSPLLAGTQASQQLRPQYPPSVSMSNASVASEASTPVYPVQSGPQHLAPGFPGPFGRASTETPEAAAHQKDGQASRWKGLRNRVTEQISQRTQQQQQQQYPQQQGLILGQNKIAVADKIRGNKLLGALRRTSKQVESTQNQGSVQPPPRQLQTLSSQPHPQGYQQQAGQLQGPQPNAMPANGHYLQASGPPPNLPRAKTMPPGPPQQSAPPRNQTRSSEPLYETVPIPRGYAAVHGEGTTIPSPYHQNLRRQMPHGQFAPLPQQHPHLHPRVQQQQQWQGGHPPLMSHYPPQPIQSLPPRMTQGPVSAPLPNERSVHMRAPSDSRADYHDARSTHTSNTQLSQHNRNSSQDSRTNRDEPRPTSGLGSNLGISHPGTPQPSETGNLSVADGTRSAPRSPVVSVGVDQKPGMKLESKTDMTAEPAAASNLGIDVEKARQLVEDNLYDATPKVVPSGTENSHEASGVSQIVSKEEAESSREAETKTGVTPVSTGVVAELEDTEEARKRAIRLASQEEKIYYEPEDFEPKMSATSYPGQEWNPFGEPEFADWKED